MSVLDTESGEAADRHAVLLVEPGKFQPELALRGGDGNEATGREDAEGHIAALGELAHARLQRTELFECAAGQELRRHGRLQVG